MDPLSALIFAMIVSGLFVRNMTQDMVFKATGKLPPSYLRQKERWEKATNLIGGRSDKAPFGERGPARGFVANAWGDAWATADESRQRRRGKRADKRRAKWAGQDGTPGSDDGAGDASTSPPSPAPDHIPAPVPEQCKEEENAPMGAAPEEMPEAVKSSGSATATPLAPAGCPGSGSPIPDEPSAPIKGASCTPFDLGDPIERAAEANYQRYAMRRRNGGSAPTAAQLADDLGIDLANAEDLQSRWDQRYQREAAAPEQDDMPEELREENWGVDEPPVQEQDGAERTCGECRKALPARLPRGYDGVSFCPRCGADAPASNRDTKEDTASAESAESAHPAGAEAPGEGEAAGPTGTPSPPSSIPKENDMTASGETTGLQSAITFNQKMAEQCGQGVTNAEMSIAALQQGEVGDSVTGHMLRGQELMAAAQAEFDAAAGVLRQHVSVQDAYAANADAGNKQFVTSE